MKVVRLEIERGQLRVCDLDTCRVLSPIEFGADLQACACRCAGDQIDNDFVTHQGSTPPVLSDVAEHPMLDLVPFAGSRREVTHMDGQSQAKRQGLQRHLPQTAPAAIAAAAVVQRAEALRTAARRSRNVCLPG